MTPVLALLLQEDPSAAVGGAAAAGLGIGMMIFILAITLLVVASWWKLFTKAGEPGWASIVPIYNFVVWLRIAGKPGWWVLLMFIPFVNFIVLILASIEFAKAFGKGTGFGLGLAFFGVIFYPILAFGSTSYSPLPATA